jgi:biopolymer transport protein TolR
MAFYFSRRKLKPREREDAGELNIVPYLDILMNLIIFMLMSITGLAAFGILNVNAPSYGGAAAGANPDGDQPQLLLSVLISDQGFHIAGSGAVLGEGAADGAPAIPLRADGAYDYAALTAKMVEIKAHYPQETRITLAANATTAYEHLIKTMDAVRETSDRRLLFPDVTLGAM